MAHKACGWEGTHAGRAAPVGGDCCQTRAAANTGAEVPPTDRRVTSNTCGVPLAGAGERCCRLGRTCEEVAIDGRCSQMAALRLVAQFPELVPVDWSAQCSVSCTCPMWKHVIDTKCSPPLMKESAVCSSEVLTTAIRGGAGIYNALLHLYLSFREGSLRLITSLSLNALFFFS